MKLALVGYTGFVGSNICASGHFDGLYNSKNVGEAWFSHPDVLVYAGVRAEKYLANQNPFADMAQIDIAFDNIDKIAPARLVLISTIDVLSNPDNADETCVSDIETLKKDGQAYGSNRLILEERVREKFPNALIVRLPALFGKNIKKNFIYDFIHRIPFMLKTAKMDELCAVDGDIRSYYDLQQNGFYKLRTIDDAARKVLKDKFLKVGFDALQFTDSRNVFQFYPLRRLWDDIQLALKYDIRLLHTATEPVSAAEVYEALTHKQFVNEILPVPLKYNYKSVYAEKFGGKNGYLCDKAQVLSEICEFVASQKDV